MPRSMLHVGQPGLQGPEAAPLAGRRLVGFALASLTAALVLVGVVAMFGRGPVLLPLPWVEASAESFTILTAVGIAYFCLGRYRVLHEAGTLWIGGAFLAYAVLGVVYLLVYPGLLGPGSVLDVHHNGWAWPFHEKWTALAALLALAALARWPARPDGGGRTLLVSVGLAAAVLGALTLLLGAGFPPLIRDGAFTPLNVGWTGALAVTFALGAGLGLVRGFRERQPVLAYAAMMQAVLSARMASDVLGGHIYDTVWYLNRILVVGSFGLMLLGLSSSYVRLLERARRASTVAEARAAELAATLNSLTDAVLVVDTDARIIDINTAALRLLRLERREQAIGPVARFRERLKLTSDDPSLTLESFPVARALEGHPVRGFLARGETPDGRDLLLEVNASPIRDAANAVTGAVVVLQDVTELEWARGRATVARVATAVAGMLRLRALIDVVLAEVRQALDTEVVMLYELDEARRQLVLLGPHPGSEELARTAGTLDLDSPTITARAVRLKQVQFLEDTQAAPPELRVARALAEQFGFRGALAVPLVVRDDAVGALLCLHRDPHAFSAHELELVTTVAEIVAVGFENARLYEQAEDERLRVLGVLEQVPAGIVLFEPGAGRVMLANSAAEALVGASIDRDSPMSEHPRRYGLLRPDGSECPAEELPSARALRGELVLAEELLVGAPGRRPTPVLVNAAPLRDRAGRIAGAVVAIQDLTRVKELERLREEFVSVIAHDLRTPLGVIEHHAHVLQRDAEHRGAGRPELDAIRAIGLSARRLAAMVTDLLDASRIEAQRLALSPQRIRLPDLVRSLVDRLQPVLARHPIRLAVPPDVPGVTADPGRIEQVLNNLLTNAAKFSPEGSEISVGIDHGEREVVVSVRDHGPGIPPEDRPVLFDRFHRTRSARDTHEGLGLGLYISRGLVEAHGGRIWIEAADGGGTVFRFTLPVDQRADSVAAA